MSRKIYKQQQSANLFGTADKVREFRKPLKKKFTKKRRK